MKKVILILVAVFTVTLTTAQEGVKKGKGKASVETRAQRSVDKLDKDVVLTADQKPKIYDLSLTRAKKIDEIKAKYKGQPEKKEDAKTEMKAAQKEYRDATKALLTPEQITILKAKNKERKDAKKAAGKQPKKAEEKLTAEEINELIPAED